MRNILCLFFKFGVLAYKRALISLWKKEKNQQKVFCQISEFVIIVYLNLKLLLFSFTQLQFISNFFLKKQNSVGYWSISKLAAAANTVLEFGSSHTVLNCSYSFIDKPNLHLVLTFCSTVWLQNVHTKLKDSLTEDLDLVLLLLHF